VFHSIPLLLHVRKSFVIPSLLHHPVVCWRSHSYFPFLSPREYIERTLLYVTTSVALVCFYCLVGCSRVPTTTTSGTSCRCATTTIRWRAATPRKRSRCVYLHGDILHTQLQMRDSTSVFSSNCTQCQITAEPSKHVLSVLTGGSSDLVVGWSSGPGTLEGKVTSDTNDSAVCDSLFLCRR